MQTGAKIGDGVVEALMTYDFPGNSPRAREHGRAGRWRSRRRCHHSRRHDDVATSSQPKAAGRRRTHRFADVVDGAERQAIRSAALREQDELARR